MAKKRIKLPLVNGDTPIDFYSWGNQDSIGIISCKEQSTEQIQGAFDSIELYEDGETPETDYVLKVLGKEAGRIVMPFDMIIEDAYYDNKTKEIVIIFNIGGDVKKEIRFSVKDLIDTYEGDGITVEVKENVISLTEGYKNTIINNSTKISELESEVDELKSEIPDLDEYYTKVEIDSKGFLTEHQDISGKADKSELPTKTSQLTNDSGFLTEHQSLDDYAKTAEIEVTYQKKGDYALKSEIPSLDGYATEQWVEDKGYLTEHQDLSDYALKTEIPSIDNFATKDELGLKADLSDVPTKTSELENDSNFLTEHQSLDGYAKIEYTDATYQVKGDYAIKSDIPVLDGYAKKSEIPTKTSELDNDSGFLTEHQDISGKADKEHKHKIIDIDLLQEQLDSKLDETAVKAILKEEIYKLFNVKTVGPTEFNSSETTNPNDSYAILGNGDTIAMTKSKQFIGKSVKLNNVDLETDGTVKAPLLINSHKVELDNIMLSGKWNRTICGNAMMSINDASQVELKGVDIERNGGYNVVEIGLNSKEHCDYIVIDGLEINEQILNNGINIFSMNDNANIIIKNCHFKQISNPIRVSNATNAKNVNITIKDCTFDKWETGVYSGLILFQDYTSKTRDEIINNKPFSTLNVTIDNVTGPYGKISNNLTMEEICASGVDEKQLIYMHGDHYSETNKAALIPYSEDMYPKIIIL